MINTDNTKNIEPEDQEPQEDTAPDENGGLYVQGFFKIHDPETGEIITQGRA
jgi:hypothetical protein